jgi:hypothetical protein
MPAMYDKICSMLKSNSQKTFHSGGIKLVRRHDSTGTLETTFLSGKKFKFSVGFCDVRCLLFYVVSALAPS